MYCTYYCYILQIHLGNDVWLPKHIYDSAEATSNTYGKFVKRMAIAVFGVKVLIASSVTGKVSNRTIARKNEKARPALDANKLGAIKSK